MRYLPLHSRGLYFFFIFEGLTIICGPAIMRVFYLGCIIFFYGMKDFNPDFMVAMDNLSALNFIFLLLTDLLIF